MTSASIGAARAFKIRGLASADFLANEGEALLLEINPRPGATLDIFDCGATPLLRLHVNAVKDATALTAQFDNFTRLVINSSGMGAPAAAEPEKKRAFLGMMGL